MFFFPKLAESVMSLRPFASFDLRVKSGALDPMEMGMFVDGLRLSWLKGERLLERHRFVGNRYFSVAADRRRRALSETRNAEIGNRIRSSHWRHAPFGTSTPRRRQMLRARWRLIS